MALGPPCPSCNETLPFARTQFGLGKVFECPNCQRQIIIDKNIWAAPLAIFSVFLVESYFNDAKITMGYILFIALMLFLISRFFNNPMTIEEYRIMYPGSKI